MKLRLNAAYIVSAILLIVGIFVFFKASMAIGIIGMAVGLVVAVIGIVMSIRKQREASHWQ